MKKNYYELQIYIRYRDYLTVCTYVGTRSNANRKFRNFAISHGLDHSCCLRISAYPSIHSMLDGEHPVRITPFYV